MADPTDDPDDFADYKEEFRPDITLINVTAAIRIGANNWPTSEPIEAFVDTIRSEADRLLRQQADRRRRIGTLEEPSS